MEASKLEAERAAFAELGYEVPKIRGARVLTVLDDGPSAEVLQNGDLVVRFGDVSIGSPEDLVAAIAQQQIGADVAATIMRDGDREEVTLRVGRVRGEARLGVTLAPAFELPVQVAIDTQRIGGPSGGLVFALALVELLDEEDLTRGRIIAVTGTISFEDGVGVIGPIGGISEKIRGAIDAGAELFIVPIEHEAEARALAPAGLEIVAAHTLTEAVASLRAD
jgi:PDZ domain-containing protein